MLGVGGGGVKCGLIQGVAMMRCIVSLSPSGLRFGIEDFVQLRCVRWDSSHPDIVNLIIGSKHRVLVKDGGTAFCWFGSSVTLVYLCLFFLWFR